MLNGTEYTKVLLISECIMKWAIIFSQQTWKHLYNSKNRRCSISEDVFSITIKHTASSSQTVLASIILLLFFKLLWCLIHRGTSEARLGIQLSKFSLRNPEPSHYAFIFKADGNPWSECLPLNQQENCVHGRLAYPEAKYKLGECYGSLGKQKQWMEQYWERVVCTASLIWLQPLKEEKTDLHQPVCFDQMPQDLIVCTHTRCRTHITQQNKSMFMLYLKEDGHPSHGKDTDFKSPVGIRLKLSSNVLQHL